MPKADLLRRSWNAWIACDPPPDGAYALQFAWTASFGAVIGLLFTLIGFVFYARGEAWTSAANWWHWLKPNLLTSIATTLAVDLALRLLGRAGAARLPGFRRWRRALFFAGVPLLSLSGGWPAAVWLAGFGFSWSATGDAQAINVGLALFAVMLSLVMYLYFDGKARHEAAERRSAEARLMLLQAQIEPHFLFNTLANVLGLVDADPQRAKQMLENFVDYLRASLGRLRVEDSTLGAELDMAEAYLRLLQVRMDDRLRFSIDADAALRAARMPPLLLQPLVENAIRHGLEPKVDGGEVTVRARRDGDLLVIDVDDDGLGLAAPRPPGRAGNGLALGNLRQRLEALHGALKIEPRSAAVGSAEDRGTRARITLPFRAAAPGSGW